MCSPCGPMVCYKYEDCGPPRGNTANEVSRAEEGGAKKRDDSENQLKRTKSRELRGGIMYYSCHCIKRNGLQHDCRRTGCGGEPSCLVLPDPVCAPSQLARARGLADPAPFAKHMGSNNGGAFGGSADPGGSGGKRFIVCELKGIMPGAASESAGKCCKCPNTIQVPSTPRAPNNSNLTGCPCKGASGSAGNPLEQQSLFLFDEKTIQNIIKSFEEKEMAPSGEAIGPGGRPRKTSIPLNKEEPCTRPGCVHSKPPPPCLWDAPCKADCFETPAGIQPGRNPLTGGGLLVSSRGKTEARNVSQGGEPSKRMKLLTPECCTGCFGPDGGASSSSGPAGGLPVMVMKLC